MQLNDATEKTFIPTKLNFNILFRLILVLVNVEVLGSTVSDMQIMIFSK